MKPYFSSVLKLHGIEASFLDGSSPPTKRVSLIEEFNSEEPHISENGEPSQVMFISNVASTGINLPRATVLIMLVRVQLFYLIVI